MKVVDNIFTGNVLFERLRGKSRPWGSGYRLRLPTTVKNRTSGGSYSGFDTFITTQEDVRQQFYIDPSQYYFNLAISGIQKALNGGQEAIVDLLATEFQDVARNMSETMGADLYLDGTGNANKAIAGLQYHVDDATTAATYQGLSRNTYTNLRATRTAQGGVALAFSNLASDYDACQRGNDSPTFGVTTPAVFTIIEALITPTWNFNINQNYPSGVYTGGKGGIKGTAGLNAINYRGIPIISDEMCTAGNLYLLNENHLFFYTIPQDPLMIVGSKEGFGWTGWKKPTNQDAITGQILWYGQLVGDSPRTMSRRTGITS